MNKHKISKLPVLALAALFLMCGTFTATAEAGGHGKHDKDLEDKIYWKVGFLKDHQEELGLSDEQVDQLKALKLDLKKELIALKATKMTAKVDIKAGLYERQLDVAALNQLIDVKYDAKRDMAKSKVRALAALKSILTDEQYEGMKKLKKEMKENKSHKKCKACEKHGWND